VPVDEGTDVRECWCRMCIDKCSKTDPASRMGDETSKDYHLLQDQYPFAASTHCDTS
jgi:hypothetical protein